MDEKHCTYEQHQVVAVLVEKNFIGCKILAFV